MVVDLALPLTLLKAQGDQLFLHNIAGGTTVSTQSCLLVLTALSSFASQLGLEGHAAGQSASCGLVAVRGHERVKRVMIQHHGLRDNLTIRGCSINWRLR